MSLRVPISNAVILVHLSICYRFVEIVFTSVQLDSHLSTKHLFPLAPFTLSLNRSHPEWISWVFHRSFPIRCSPPPPSLSRFRRSYLYMIAYLCALTLLGSQFLFCVVVQRFSASFRFLLFLFVTRNLMSIVIFNQLVLIHFTLQLYCFFFTRIGTRLLFYFSFM